MGPIRRCVSPDEVRRYIVKWTELWRATGLKDDNPNGVSFLHKHLVSKDLEKRQLGVFFVFQEGGWQGLNVD